MRRQTLKNFVVSFTVSTLLFSLATQSALDFHKQGDLNTLKVANKARVENAQNVLDARLERAVTELRTIADTPVVKSLIEKNTQMNRVQTQNLFMSFAREQKLFNQIRYLDQSGQEIVRVDYDAIKRAHVIPDDQLQNKKDRYYFQNAIHLDKGDISISPLDLNIERDEIEIPYNPMIRFSMPVFDQQGKTRGVLIINLFGQAIIDRYKKVMGSNTQNQTMLIDQDANWLVAPDPQLEWGFMFGRSNEFAQQHPQVWAEISRHYNGHFQNEDGLYTYNTVYPLNWAVNSAKSLDDALVSQRAYIKNHHYAWKIITFTPTVNLPSSALNRSYSTLFLYLLGVFFLLLITALLSYFVATRQVLRRELALNNRQHKEILNNLGEGIAVLNKDSVVIETNPEAERLLGRSRSEIIGQNAHELFHGHSNTSSSQHSHACEILKVTHSGQIYRNEDEVFYRKDHSPLEVGVVVTPLTTEDEEMIGAVVAFRDMTKIKAYQDRIYHLAYHDILTHLPNRRLLNDHMGLTLKMAERYERKFALIFIDLDKFKGINDLYGHDAGDVLLNWVASKLKVAVREVDTVSRQGGDEFVILLSEVKSVENVNRVAAKILNEITLQKANILGHLLDVGMSMGIAVYPDHGKSIEALMQAADHAMYIAKRSGSNQYCISGEDPKSVAS